MRTSSSFSVHVIPFTDSHGSASHKRLRDDDGNPPAGTASEAHVDTYANKHFSSSSDVVDHGGLVSFAEVAELVTDTAQMKSEIDHALRNQESEISNAPLAKAVLDGTCTQIEQQKFERISASDEERASFFNDPDVLKIISKEWLDPPFVARFKPLKWDDAMEFEKFGTEWAIQFKRFGPDFDARQAIVNNLGVFTDPEAQGLIALAIQDGRLGTDLNVLQTIANNLHVFTDPEAQRLIALAIQDGRLGTDSNVLQAIANNLGVFTDPEAQTHIAVAIRCRRFGTDLNVLQTIANNLGIFTDPQAQRAIASAIGAGRLGTDPNVLKTISRIPVYHQVIISLMPGLVLTLEEKISILGQMKFSLSLPSEVGAIPAENLPELFGAKAYSGSEVLSLLEAKFSAILLPNSDNADAVNVADAIKDIFEVDKHYALQLRGTRLIVYPLTADRADFRGWITSDEKVLYKQCVTNVMVYDFGKLDAYGFPKMLESNKLSPRDELFATLPGYLQQAIRDNHFDVTEFKHQKTIAFVTETLLKPLKDINPAVATQMQAVMQASIVSGGDYVKIALSNEKDVEIKDAINALCWEVSNKINFSVITKTFLDELPSVADKARLAVLLGTMAKKGVLGYHHGTSRNQANDLLYSLARQCFDELKGATGIVFPANFHADLARGLGIEYLINDFIRANADRIDFHDVFAPS